MFDQPCQRGHLPLNPDTLTIENKPVMILGDPSKPQNDNIKTKLKNIHELGQMQACSDTVNQLHRPCSKLCHNVGLSDFRENRVNSKSYEEASGGSHSALCGSLETLGEAHSINNNSTTRVIVAQVISALAHPKMPVSDTRRTHKDQSHTLLHASRSMLVTAAVSPHRSSIRTSTCTLGSHKDGCQPSQLGGGGGYGAGSVWHLERGSAHINVLDLTAVFLTLLYFQTVLRGKHFLVRTDHRVAIFYFNHQGGKRSE